MDMSIVKLKSQRQRYVGSSHEHQWKKRHDCCRTATLETALSMIFVKPSFCIPCIASRDEQRKRSRDEDENGEAHVVKNEFGYTKGGGRGK